MGLTSSRRHRAVIEEVTATHGGTVVETQGDGSMLAFPSARRAVPAHSRSNARSQRDSPTDRRRFASGSESTPATPSAKTDHFFGTTVHYAARVAGHALGGEVLVSNFVRDLVAGPASSSSNDARWN